MVSLRLATRQRISYWVTTFLVQTLNRLARVTADTSMGVVFATMFAVGLILLKRYTGGNIDIDAECVFLGSLDFVGIVGQPGVSSDSLEGSDRRQ